MLKADFKEINKLTEAALQAVEDREFSKAKSVLRRLENAFASNEAVAAQVLIEALILLKRNKKRKAQELILKHNLLAWSDSDLLCLLRMTNPPVDRESKLFEITFIGGSARFGIFTQFSRDHVCTLSIIANDQLEALNYIRALCLFADEKTLKIIRSGTFDRPEEEEFRGIIRTSPFRPLDFEIPGASST